MDKKKQEKDVEKVILYEYIGKGRVNYGRRI